MPVVQRADSKAATGANLNVQKLEGVFRSGTLSVKKKLGGGGGVSGGREKETENTKPTTVMEEKQQQQHHRTGSGSGASKKRQERSDMVAEGGGGGGPGGDKKRESGFSEKVKAKMYTTGGLLDRAKTVKWANMGSLKRMH